MALGSLKASHLFLFFHYRTIISATILIQLGCAPDRLFLIPEHKYALMSSSSRYPTFLAPFPSVTIYTQFRLQGSRIRLVRGLVKFVPAH